MGIDRTEEKERNQSPKQQNHKSKRKYAPYADIQHRIIDSAHISNLVVASSALFGTLSHVWLDSQFHVEMARLTPGLLKLWQTGDVTTNIETACLAAAELALLIYAMRCLLCKIWQRLRGR